MPHVEIPLAEFKVVILGDSHIGKTSLVTRFAEGYYRENSRPATVGAFFVTKRIQSSPPDNVPTKIQIWDTAGAESFRAMAPMFYKNAAAVIVCYDVTRRESYDGMREWLDGVRRKVKVGEDVVVAIAALKTDLLQDNNNNNINTNDLVPEHEVEQMAEALGVIYQRTSAKMDHNVNDLFQCVADQVLQNQKYHAQQNNNDNNGNGGNASSPDVVVDKDMLANNRGGELNPDHSDSSAAMPMNDNNDRIKIISPRKRDQFDKYYISTNSDTNNNNHQHQVENNANNGNDNTNMPIIPPPESSKSKYKGSRRQHSNSNSNGNSHISGNQSVTPSVDGTACTDGSHPLIVGMKKDGKSSSSSKSKKRNSKKGTKDVLCDDTSSCADESDWACQPVACGAGEGGMGCIVS